MSVGKRLAEERRRAEIGNQENLSNKLSVSLTTVSRWEQGQSVLPSDKLILMESLGMDINYILTGNRVKKTGNVASFFKGIENPLGDGIKRLNESMGIKQNSPSFDLSNYAQIPLFDVQVSAGAGAFVSEENILTHLTFTKYSLRKKGFDAHNLMCVTVAGDSMMPTLEPHETVMIDTTKRQIDGGIFVIRVGESVHIKRLIQEKDSIRVISDNTKYPEWTLDKTDDFEIIGQKIWQAKWS